MGPACVQCLARIMYVVLFVVAMAAGALAQVPSACPGPKMFEARFSRFDRERKYYVQGAIIYDGVNQRIREFEDEHAAGDHEAYLKLYLYKENKEYRLNLKNRTCYGVPPNATFEADATIGVAGKVGEGLQVAEFKDQMKFGNDTVDFSVTVSEPHCYPVTHAMFSTVYGLEVTHFYDGAEAPIFDPRVWEPPRECRK